MATLTQGRGSAALLLDRRSALRRVSRAVAEQRVRRRLRVVNEAAPTAPATGGQQQQTAQQMQQAVQPTVWVQRTIELPPYPRGCHIITRIISDAVPELHELEVGLCNLFIMHTSASLTVNENASPDVRLDLNDALDRIAPEGPQYRHDDEGPDDMPAHVKSSLMGPSLTIPVAQGRLALGVWQGVYMNEHRNYGGPRRVMVTLQGQRRADGRKYSRFA